MNASLVERVPQCAKIFSFMGVSKKIHALGVPRAVA